MPAPCSFRQVEEKHASEARLMVWSPRMDLLALANVQGEVKTSVGLLDKVIKPTIKYIFMTEERQAISAGIFISDIKFRNYFMFRLCCTDYPGRKYGHCHLQ